MGQVEAVMGLSWDTRSLKYIFLYVFSSRYRIMSYGTLSCRSNVTIKKCMNNKIKETHQYHNIVTNKLLVSIVQFLISGFNNWVNGNTLTPRYLGLSSSTSDATRFAVDSEKLTNETSKNNRIKLKSISTELESGTAKCVFVASIPGKIYSSVAELGLFANESDDTSMLAAVKLDETMTLGAGTSLVVEWEMSLSNVVEISE